MRSRSGRAGPFLCFLLSIVLIGALLSDAALGQQPSDPPLPVDPSQLEQQFDERRLPSSTFVIEQQAVESSDFGPSADIRFTLKSIELEGVSAIDESELEALYRGMVGTEISVARLFDLAGLMSAYYRNAGYILSRVTVPAQEVVDGTVRLVAVEGYIENVTLDGESGPAKRLLQRLGNKIKRSKPLRAKDLERYMLLANDIPGVTATAVLRASETPGATDLTIVLEHDKADAFLSLNNRGSRFNGPLQGQLSANVNSLVGNASRTGVRVIGSGQLSELQLYEASHMHILGSEGTTIELIGRYTRSRPGGSLSDLDIQSNSVFGQMILQHPVVRSRSGSLYVRGVVDIRNTETDILGEPFTEDRVRVVRAGATLDFVDRLNGINLLDVQVSRGLDVLNATQTRTPFQSRADAETDFVKVSASATRLQRVAPGVSILIDAAGQYTKDGLVASEEFAIGGNQFGRAFDPSEIAGDRAIAARTELRFDHTLDRGWLKNIQLYAFGDYGIVWNQSTNGYVSTDLGSVGGGLRLTLSDRISAYGELAVPYQKTENFSAQFGNSVRGFAGLSFIF